MSQLSVFSGVEISLERIAHFVRCRRVNSTQQQAQLSAWKQKNKSNELNGKRKTREKWKYFMHEPSQSNVDDVCQLS